MNKEKQIFDLQEFFKRLTISELFGIIYFLPMSTVVAAILIDIVTSLLRIFGLNFLDINKMSFKEVLVISMFISFSFEIYIVWKVKKRSWKEEIGRAERIRINEKASYPFLKKKLRILREKFDEIQKRIHYKTAILQNIEQTLKQKRIHPDYLKSLRGVEFENCLYDCFKTLGYFVEKTPSSGDYGVDLVLKYGDKKIAVQIKGTADPVGIKAIQEVYSGKDFYDCGEAWVITNSYFTNSAIKLAKKLNVGLINRQKLLKFLPDADLIEENKKLIKELEELNARKKEIKWEISEISEKLEYIKTKYDFE